MVSKISEGVKVSVETFYQHDYSNPLQSEYMFAYRIRILNGNMFPIQVMHRHWVITEGDASTREIDGEGIIGVQPVINPGEEYFYVSGANIHTEIGRMYGHYLMLNKRTNAPFTVNIPTFELIPPFKLN